jgi:uncharacterized protein
MKIRLWGITWSAVLFAGLLVFGTAGADSPAPPFRVPTLTGPVVDAAGAIDPSIANQINLALRQLKDSGGSQINVLTLPDLGGLEIEQASIQVVDQWKLGDKKISNGVLLILAIKERKVRIEVGQGLEGVLPDAISKRIIDQQMRPLLSSGAITDAILVGVAAIAKVTDPGFDFEEALQLHRRASRSHSGGRSPLFIIFIILFFLFFGRRGGPRGPMFIGGFGGGGGGSGFGGGSWGGGGGGFNGGGASGDW